VGLKLNITLATSLTFDSTTSVATNMGISNIGKVLEFKILSTLLNADVLLSMSAIFCSHILVPHTNKTTPIFVCRFFSVLF